MAYYVCHADLNSLYDEQPTQEVVHSRVETEEEAKALVSELQTHDVASWYTWNDCQDAIGKWDSENPCLSWLPSSW